MSGALKVRVCFEGSWGGIYGRFGTKGKLQMASEISSDGERAKLPPNLRQHR